MSGTATRATVRNARAAGFAVLDPDRCDTADRARLARRVVDGAMEAALHPEGSTERRRAIDRTDAAVSALREVAPREWRALVDAAAADAMEVCACGRSVEP